MRKNHRLVLRAGEPRPYEGITISRCPAAMNSRTADALPICDDVLPPCPKCLIGFHTCQMFN